MEKPKRKVGMPLRVLCVLFSPFLIYMAWRMHKVRKALVLVAFDIAIGEILGYLIPWPYYMIIDLGITIPLFVHYVNKWSREWNAEINNINSQSATDEIK